MNETNEWSVQTTLVPDETRLVNLLDAGVGEIAARSRRSYEMFPQ